VGQLVLGLLVGAALGAAVCALLMFRSTQGRGEELAEARAARQVAEARASELALTIERERENHEAALAALSDRFKVVASDTLEKVVAQFHAGQLQVLEQREAKLDERITPLSDLLREYKEKVEQLETNRETGFVNVQNIATQLLEAQAKVIDEASKLNTILGRSSARGRWGEIQLVRILELANMTKYVDFNPQLTIKAQGDGRQRPDVVVQLPRGAQIAIDSKVPYDAFDRAMSTDVATERDAALKEYASSMRQHVLELKKRSYWESLVVSPAFVICFVPSDHLLAAAFDADPTMLEDAMKAGVLVAGPTTLLGLLWATYLGWNQFEAAENIEEISALASRIVERTATLFEHSGRLGKSLNSSTQHFNSLVGSMESSLLVTVREMQRKGVKSSKGVDDVELLPQLTRPLDPTRWLLPGESDGDVLDVQIIESPELESGDSDTRFATRDDTTSEEQ
jgi:DNA recombination protein RmuC